MASSELNLLHLVNLRSANVGNGALTLGVERLMTEDLRQSPRFERLAWDDYSFGLKPFDRDFVAAVNASDGLIVGGAVALHGRIYCSNAGMRFDLPYELWDEIKKPLVFYGLSHRHWPGKPYHHADKLKAAFEAILRRDNMMLGLRNDGTRTWLKETLHFESDRFVIVPDPAVFVPFEDGEYPEIENGRPNIILAFNDEDREDRYGTPERRMTVIKALARSMEQVLEKSDANLILAAHYFDDNRMMSDFIDACRPQIAHQRMIMIGSTRIGGCRKFYGRYRNADLVVAMRVHSMSPAIGLGVPMVPVITQERMYDFLRDVGLDDLAVDAFAADMTEQLVAAVENGLVAGGRLRERFAVSKAQMREQALAVNRKIQALFDA